jgi:hypothetical protein
MGWLLPLAAGRRSILRAARLRATRAILCPWSLHPDRCRLTPSRSSGLTLLATCKPGHRYPCKPARSLGSRRWPTAQFRQSVICGGDLPYCLKCGRCRCLGAVAQPISTTASNASFSDGRIDCNNFTIQAGVTLTIPNGFLWIEAAGDVTIPGTINITAPIAGGGAFSGGALVQYYAIESGRGLGGGGYSGGAAAPYPHYASPFGSGGASGFGSVSGSQPVGTIFQSRGGNGGGVVVIRAAGRIIITGAINCDGAAGTAGSASGSPPGVVVLTGGGGAVGANPAAIPHQYRRDRWPAQCARWRGGRWLLNQLFRQPLPGWWWWWWWANHRRKSQRQLDRDQPSDNRRGRRT